MKPTKPTTPPERLPYVSPKLTKYGHFSKLTAAGSGMVAEGSMMTDMTRRA
jgi:hypothetical protein